MYFHTMISFTLVENTGQAHNLWILFSSSESDCTTLHKPPRKLIVRDINNINNSFYLLMVERQTILPLFTGSVSTIAESRDSCRAVGSHSALTASVSPCTTEHSLLSTCLSGPPTVAKTTSN